MAARRAARRKSAVKRPRARRPRVQTGLDRVAAGDREVLRRLRGRRLGLLSHPAAVDADLRPALAVLRDAGCDVRVLFGPEHGYGGEAQDMIAVGEGQSE